MKTQIRIEGMHCESCAKIIAMELNDKVDKIEVDIAGKKATIEFDPSKIQINKIKEIINNLGYKTK